MSKKRKAPVFWICFAVFVLVMVVFWVFVISYVKKCLVIYENSQPEYIVEEFMDSLENGIAFDNVSFTKSSSRFENPDIYKEKYLKDIEGKTYTYEKSAQSYDSAHPAYNIYADDALIAQVTLNEVSSEPLMLILSSQEWEIESIEPLYTTGTQGVTVVVPDNYSVFVNDVKLDSRELTGVSREIDDFQYAKEYVDVPKLVEYRVEGMLNAPDVTIYNNQGEMIMYAADEQGNICVDSFMTSTIDAGLAAQVLLNARNYSNFFSRDIEGCRSSVAPIAYMFPENSYYLELAENYRLNDMWMYSAHETPVFTGEMVSNYVVYTPELFSVDVYFEKNMTLTLNGENRQDITNTRYFYAKINDEWLIVDMQSVTR